MAVAVLVVDNTNNRYTDKGDLGQSSCEISKNCLFILNEQKSCFRGNVLFLILHQLEVFVIKQI